MWNGFSGLVTVLSCLYEGFTDTRMGVHCIKNDLQLSSTGETLRTINPPNVVDNHAAC